MTMTIGYFLSCAEAVAPFADGLITTSPESDLDRHIHGFEPWHAASFDEVDVANIGPHYREIQAYGGAVLPAVRPR